MHTGSNLGPYTWYTSMITTTTPRYINTCEHHGSIIIIIMNENVCVRYAYV